jgi:hypothetical protein
VEKLKHLVSIYQQNKEYKITITISFYRGDESTSDYSYLGTKWSICCISCYENRVRSLYIYFNYDLFDFCSTSSGGQLVFVDASDMTIMSKQEHPDLSDVEWDSTGRYVTSSVNLWNAKVY